MYEDRLQIAVWLMTPIIGLLLLVLMIGARGAVFNIPLLILAVLLVIGPIWYYQLREPS